MCKPPSLEALGPWERAAWLPEGLVGRGGPLCSLTGSGRQAAIHPNQRGARFEIQILAKQNVNMNFVFCSSCRTSCVVPGWPGA